MVIGNVWQEGRQVKCINIVKQGTHKLQPKQLTSSFKGGAHHLWGGCIPLLPDRNVTMESRIHGANLSEEYSNIVILFA